MIPETTADIAVVVGLIFWAVVFPAVVLLDDIEGWIRGDRP